MRARQVFMDSLLAHGVEAIFGNPGTTENPLLDSLIDYPAIAYYVALQESVAVCAAAFYAQSSGRTAVANVHVAPGLGNAIGMMYGALKACAPLIVTAGQQDTRMRLRDPILGHDLVAMAAPVAKWAVQVQSGDEMATIMRRAFKIANTEPRGPVFVALPINVMEQETSLGAETAGVLHAAPGADPAGVERLAELLLAARNPVIVAGDAVPVQGANDLLVELAERCGATVYSEFLRARQPIPFQHPNFRGRIPYEASKIAELLGGHDLLLMIGGQFFEEVWFDADACVASSTIVAQIESAPARLAHNFSLDLGLVGAMPSTLAALNAAISSAMSAPGAEAAGARNAALSARRAAEAASFARQIAQEQAATGHPLSAAHAFQVIARALPPDAIVVDESITAGMDLTNAFALDGADNFFAGRGGGIGQGVAGALGVAVANPGRPIIALSGDGSAMYSIQALWTAAHHRLDVVFVILSNREYRILKHNMDVYRRRFDAISDKPYPHMNLAEPVLGFVEMAAGMGVPGAQVTSADELHEALARALAAGGPHLIDVVVAGKP